MAREDALKNNLKKKKSSYETSQLQKYFEVHPFHMLYCLNSLVYRTQQVRLQCLYFTGNVVLAHPSHSVK